MGINFIKSRENLPYFIKRPSDISLRFIEGKNFFVFFKQKISNSYKHFITPINSMSYFTEGIIYVSVLLNIISHKGTI